MPKAKEPDARCTMRLITGNPLKVIRCRNAACGWDALKRRACRDHMPKALWPVESRAVVKPNAELRGNQQRTQNDD